AKLLHDAGHLTALVGKWHLGDGDHFPETHGFDVNVGGTRWGAPTTFFWPYRGAGRFGTEFRYVPHLEFGKPGEYLTDRLTGDAPMRSVEGWVYEGGIRIPLLVRWPGMTTPAAECHEPVLFTDLFHTLLAAAGLPKPEGLPADGLDIAPLMKNPAGHLEREA